MKLNGIALISLGIVGVLVQGLPIAWLAMNRNSVLPWTGFFEYTTKKTVEREDKDPQGKPIKVTEEIQAGKTYWDLLQLAGVPFVLAGGGYLLNQQGQQRAGERETAEKRRAEEREEAEQNRAAANLREEALQTYFDCISELLLEHSLGQPNGEKNPARDIARARTLTVLSRLEGDGKRKAAIVGFLYEAELLKKEAPIIHFREADLSMADFSSIVLLSEANLNEATLNNSILMRADLREANLRNTDLSGVDLQGADLTDADLRGAILNGTKLNRAILLRTELRGVDLSSAVFSGANLSGAILNKSILNQVNLNGLDLSNAILSEAKLSDTSLRKANLKAAVLEKADLK